MITEVIEYIRTQIETTAIDGAYQDFRPSTEEENVCAVRSLPGGVTTNTLNCNKNYTEQLFSILYRGTKDRLVSLNAIDEAYELLNNQSDIDLTNTKIAHIQAIKPSFAFVDENSIVHYNFNINVIYNKK